MQVFFSAQSKQFGQIARNEVESSFSYIHRNILYCNFGKIRSLSAEHEQSMFSSVLVEGTNFETI